MLHAAPLKMASPVTNGDINNGNSNGSINLDLDARLKELTLMKTPERSRRKMVYLGDDVQHDRPGELVSPSPKKQEIKRAEDSEDALRNMSQAYHTLLKNVGEDPTRQGLLKTPERAAKALLYFTKGYDQKISGKDYTVTRNIGLGLYIYIYRRTHGPWVWALLD